MLFNWGAALILLSAGATIGNWGDPQPMLALLAVMGLATVLMAKAEECEEYE